MYQDDNPRTGEYIPGGSQRQGWQAFSTRFIPIPVATRMFGFGTMLAIAISYTHNESIGWAILHGLFSWLFVIYAALFY